VARRRLRVSLLGNLATTVVLGGIVALVGENGSGKTTLAKLLCRLYLPQRGRVLWDEVDTATADPDGLRRSVAVIFQDFLHYSLPASENIGMGHHQRIDDAEAIRGRPCTPAPTTSWPSCPTATTWPSWTPGPSTSCSRASRPCTGAGRCC
jgi:ABC-type glutathione transport system ATPase component